MYCLVWIPKYRKRMLQGALKTKLEFWFQQYAEMNDWKIAKLNIQIDYVDILIQLKPTISVSKAIQ